MELWADVAGDGEQDLAVLRLLGSVKGQAKAKLPIHSRPLEGYADSQMVVDEPAHASCSRSDAESDAAGWLEELISRGRQAWKMSTPTSVECRPIPELPCRVFSFAEPAGGGFVPCFGLIAGHKRRGQSWQYTTIDPTTGIPLPPEVALSEIETIIDILIPTSMASVPGPVA